MAITMTTTEGTADQWDPLWVALTAAPLLPWAVTPPMAGTRMTASTPSTVSDPLPWAVAPLRPWTDAHRPWDMIAEMTPMAICMALPDESKFYRNVYKFLT